MNQPADIRPPARTVNYWKDDTIQQEMRHQRWQEYRSCADCEHWSGHDDDENNGVAICRLQSINGGVTIAPEDWWCDDWQHRNREFDWGKPVGKEEW